MIDKLKKVTDNNPYIVNWVILLKDRQQRVSVDNFIALFLPVNQSVPQGTVLWGDPPHPFVKLSHKNPGIWPFHTS